MREQGRGRERIPSRLLSVGAEPDAGLELTNREIMTWAKTKSLTLNRLSHLDAPKLRFNTSFHVIITPNLQKEGMISDCACEETGSGELLTCPRDTSIKRAEKLGMAESDFHLTLLTKNGVQGCLGGSVS